MRGLSMLAFLPMLLLLTVLYLAFHGIIFFSVVRFFNVQALSTRIFIGSVVALLGASFFISSVIVHYINASVTRGLYMLSAAWVGSMIYVVLFFGVAWLVAVLSKATHNPVLMSTLGIISLLAAVIVSVYGLWNAQNPRMHQVSVHADAFPDQWKQKKVIFVSDIHLGFIYREAQARELVERINNEKPDLVFIGGDLFDGSDGDLDWVRASLKNLRASQGVYYVTGNHETYLGLDKALGVVGKTNIIALRDQKTIVDGVQIIGVDYPQPGEKKDVVAVLKNIGFDPTMPSILLNHAPIQVTAAKDAGVTLQLSGHTHLGQLYPFALITRMIYKGYDYGLKQVATENGTFSIYTSNGFGTWGPPMRTGNTPELVILRFE